MHIEYAMCNVQYATMSNVQCAKYNVQFRKYSICRVLQKFEEPCRILKKFVHACVVNVIHAKIFPGFVL